MIGRIFLFGALLLSLNTTGAAQTRARVTPDALVRNLYAARKRPATDPFFQTKSRARLYKYFATVSFKAGSWMFSRNAT